MTVRFLIAGTVQGVGFRYFVARRAGNLGLAGWTRNLSDGRVEVLVAGPATSVDQLEQDLRRGPPRSRVTVVARTEVSDEQVSSKTFDII
jgi:acylphosphatase